MARKKPNQTSKTPVPKRTSKLETAPSALVKKNLVVIKGYEAWGEWLEAFARSENMPATVLIDHALREHAKRRGYSEPPARF